LELVVADPTHPVGDQAYTGRNNMSITVSLLVAAAGAVLISAVTATVSGLNIHTVGVILLIVGVIGFVVSLFFWSSWGGFGARNTTIVHEPGVER
jgi:beta-lactamase regulating signal transducer with metallopeptidase domain